MSFNWKSWFRRSALDEEIRKFDPFAHAVTVIQEQHRLVHDGMFYLTSGKQTGWLDAGVKRFLISTPAGAFPHIQQMNLNFERGDIDFVAYEGATTSADGTALDIENVNRNSSNTPNTDLFAEPTVTDVGTHIFTLWAPPTSTGTGQSSNGIAGVGQGSEWLLAPSTKYLIVMTNNSGATIDWSYEFSWYELAYPEDGTAIDQPSQT